VKGRGQGVNNTRMKGKEVKNRKGENMRSWKKCVTEKKIQLKEIEMEAAGR